MLIKQNKFSGVIFLLLVLLSCKPVQEDSGKETAINERVTVAPVTRGNISVEAELNATSQYLKEHWINAPVSGYITKANCIPGNSAAGDETLFEIKTREATVLDQASGGLAAGFSMKSIQIKADVPGFISRVMHQAGDFVSEGETLASIKETGSLVFILNLPYEWNSRARVNMPVKLCLPDSRIIPGQVITVSSTVDPVSQTLNVYVKVLSPLSIPEGLTAKALLPLHTSRETQVVPRSAVLANETETAFWVMKMIDDTTAIKIMIRPGLQNKDSIEIIEPVFSDGEKLLLSGNYGVPDTVYVKVIP